jgi:hypothetical protein
MIAGPICRALTVVRFAAAALALLIAGAVSLHATSMVRVSDNGRYLIDSQGKPFLWQGDTEWELTHFLTADDAAALLHARKKQGFTVIQVMATGVFPEWNLQQKVRAPADLRAWLDGDPLAPNEVFFARMDRIVAAAKKECLLLVIGVYHAKDVEAGRVTLANVGPWSRWLAARYKNALVPDQSLLPKPGENAACRSSDGDWELVYVPDATAGAVAVRLSGVTTNKNVRVAWLDPRDGATVNAGEFPSTATPSVEPPKGWEDALLIVEPLR